GTPLTDAWVLVGNGTPIVGQPDTFSFSSHTDATGHYSVMVDPPGAYNVVAVQSGFEDSDPVDITVSLDTMTTQNFALVKAMPGDITGVVTDADTQDPIESATVEAIVDPSSESKTAKTDAAGNYTLSNVLSGRRQVSAEAKGYAGDIQTVKVLAGQTATANFNLTEKPPRRGPDNNGLGRKDR